MKYLIFPTQDFSGRTDKKTLTFNDLPDFVKLYIKKYNKDVFTVLDESSYIKTNMAVQDHKKSQRTQRIKMLSSHTKERLGMTGTFMSKSPVNAFDQVEFLNPGYFGEMFSFAETYTITINLRIGRGRRITIPKKDYMEIRRKLSKAFYIGGHMLFSTARVSIMKFYGLSIPEIDHIVANKAYLPFMNMKQLDKSISGFTYKLKRSDVFDIENDYYIYNPIRKPVKLGAKAKKIANELIKVGFTDNLVLGKAAALELLVRLQDICNGFEPIKNVDTGLVSYEPLKENPKMDQLMELLDEIDVTNNQVIIWSTRVNAFEEIKQQLEKRDISTVVYYGKASADEKQDAQKQIIDRSAQVFLANPHSAAFGLNALRDIGYVIWYCMDSSVEKRYQATHRVLRGESTTPKFSYEIYVEKSVEERIYESLRVGKDLLDGDVSESTFWFK